MKTMNSSVDWSDVFSLATELSTALIGFLGVVVGAYVARLSSRKQSKIDALRAAYSNVFERYLAWVSSQDLPHASALAAAICSAMLLAGPDTRKSLGNFLDVIIKPKPEPSACQQALDDFWDCAEKEVRKGYGE